MADRELSPRAQKAVFAAVVCVLSGVGLYLTFAPRGEEQGQADPSPSPSAAAGIDPGQVDEWFPWSREEFAAGGTAAAAFVEELGTVDAAAEDHEAYQERMDALTVHGLAAAMQTEEGGTSGPWRPLAEEGGSWRGRASVEEVTYYDRKAVTYTVSGEAVGREESTELGAYSVTVRREDGEWLVERVDLLSG